MRIHTNGSAATNVKSGFILQMEAFLMTWMPMANLFSSVKTANRAWPHASDSRIQTGTIEEQQATLVTQKLKDLHVEIARCWGISADVIAGATFELGVIEIVRRVMADLAAPTGDRGAS
jgi:hypothetical protein